MRNEATLNEERLFANSWDDGLLDLLCGAALLAMGIGWVSGLGPLAAVQAPFWVVLWSPLRRSLVEPRAGYVQFSQPRRQRTERGLWQVLALGAGVLALAISMIFVLRSADRPPASPTFVAGLPGVLIAIPASLTAMLTGARRFYVYAAVLVAGAAVTAALDATPAAPIIAAGVVVALTGGMLMARFMNASRESQESS